MKGRTEKWLKLEGYDNERASFNLTRLPVCYSSIPAARRAAKRHLRREDNLALVDIVRIDDGMLVEGWGEFPDS